MGKLTWFESLRVEIQRIVKTESSLRFDKEFENVFGNLSGQKESESIEKSFGISLDSTNLVSLKGSSLEDLLGFLSVNLNRRKGKLFVFVKLENSEFQHSLIKLLKGQNYFVVNIERQNTGKRVRLDPDHSLTLDLSLVVNPVNC